MPVLGKNRGIMEGRLGVQLLSKVLRDAASLEADTNHRASETTWHTSQDGWSNRKKEVVYPMSRPMMMKASRLSSIGV